MKVAGWKMRKVSGEAIDSGSTVAALMGSTEGSAQSKIHGNSGGLILHA